MPLKAYKMKKLYATNKALLSNKNLYPFLIMAILLISTVYSSYGQVRVPFTPRTSSATPTTTVYNVKGDFTMIGNTNLTLVNYTDTANNNADMRYIDIDGTTVPGNNTFNSSSAYLDFSTENSAIPECSNIIYAGLYWTGRARNAADDNADGDNDPNTFEVTKNGITKAFDKRKVSIKGPSSPSYTPFTANVVIEGGIPRDEIYYPAGTDENMYSAYTEITDYVILNGIGDYFVADIATVEGNGGNNGYYGGWGMVVVYENSKMKWRDITVFDGHAYVPPSSTISYDIPVNGFNAVQNGDVNLKLGIMAGEGDVGIPGDYFEIQRQIDGAFQRLSHTGNTTGNFFNSSITNTNRAPNLLNNTGVDIAMFNIDNTGNAIIDNNQTSTTLRYGSTHDTYIIFNVTFSVDAYIPETQGVLTNTSIDGNPPGSGNTTLEPNEDADYAIEIRNTGTEAINNTVITVPIPDSVNPTNLNIDYNLFPPLTSATNPNIPFYDPNIGPNGSIVWNLGTLPVPANPDVVLAEISFSLTVTTDCTVLGDPDFDPNVSVNGTISGVGATSNISFTTALIQGYLTDGLCEGEPIPTPSIIEIDYIDYINEPPTASNPSPIEVACIDDVPAFDITVVTDEADNQGTPPTVAFVSDVSDGNTCPEVITRTYSVTDDCNNQILVTQTITVNDTTLPTASNPATITVPGGPAPAPDITVVTDEADNCTVGPLVEFVSDSSDNGDCPETITRTYSVTDDCGNSIEVEQTILITDPILPTASNPDPIGVECIEDVPAFDITVVTDEADNQGIPVVAFVGDSSDGNTCPETITRTYSVTDVCGNSIEVEQTITVNDVTDPTVSGTIAETTVEGCSATDVTAPVDTVAALEALGLTIGDNCTDDASLVVTSTDTATGTCPVVVTRTYTITDACGNSSTASQTINVDDTTLPTASNPATITVPGGPAPAPDITVVTDEADNCTVGPLVEFVSDSSDNGDCPETITRTYSVTDDCGNSIEVEQTILITDPILPTASNPDPIGVECIEDVPAFDITVVTDEADNQGIPVVAFVGDSSDGNTCPETITRTYSVTDVCGNSIEVEQTITVNDVTDPTVSGTIAETTVEGCSATDVTAPVDTVAALEALGLTIGDNCTDDASLVVTSTDTATGTCPVVVTRTYTITDACGNSSTASQTINVDDTTSPILTLPANQTAECSDDLSPIAFGTATATDNCDSNPVITFSDETTEGSCPGSFTITRTWTATDACGNAISADQTISTSDTKAPEFDQTDLPQDLTIECNSIPNPETLTATDNCGSATIEVNDTRTDGDCPNNYIITRVYTATDDCDNTNTHIQIITVVDITPPTFDAPLPATNLVVECDAIPVAETLTAADTCGLASVSVEDVITDGDCENNYTIARTWTATDECGLTTPYTQIITVQDTTPPAFEGTLPDIAITVECDSIPNAETITATDNCSDVTIEVNDVRTDGDCPNNYIILRTWTATDECGLMTAHTQTITVQDTTAPVPTSTFDDTLNVSCTDIPDAPELEFTDNCSSNVIVVFNETNSFDENVLVDYEIVRTWTVRDECNNQDVYTQTLFVALDEVITDIIAEDRCYDDGIVNLNDYIGDLNKNGVWELLEGDTAATLNDNGVFDPSGLELSETFLPKDGGIDYEFRYTTTDNGCISITELTMNINADCVVLPCGENDVVVSKAVTPNGDAYNEFFEIKGVELCGFIYEVKIFNRWGALIYESDNYQNDWNGKAMNSIGAAGKVPNGTYYYIVILKNSGLNPITGPVYLGTK